MVILMPPENCSNDRGYKMPFVACEIFERELSSILDPFFTAEDLSCAEEPITETKFDTLEDRLPGLYFAGNFRRGISIGDSVICAHETAHKIIEQQKAPSNNGKSVSTEDV